MPRVVLLGSIVCASIVAGCAESSQDFSNNRFAAKENAPAFAKSEMPADMNSMAGAVPTATTAAAAGENTQAKSDRKIVYEATIRLVVEEFSVAETQIPKLAKQYEGYIANANVDTTQGAHRSGSWTVRIPVEKYDAFVESIVALGVPETRNQKAQDVSAEYIDLEARISNKKKLEERILQLLADRSGEIKDIIAVETELGRVREEIERAEGQLRYLANRVSLTTVTIVAREERNYQPPTAPTFAARVKSAWTNSIEALETFGANLAVAIVYLLPWLVLFLILAILLAMAIWVLRRLLRRV
jgi:hypothetical protein